MKKHWKDIVFFACVALVAIMLACAITGCQEYKQEHFKTRIYELVNKNYRSSYTSLPDDGKRSRNRPYSCMEKRNWSYILLRSRTK